MSDDQWISEGERGRMVIRQLGPRFATLELVGHVDEDCVSVLDEALSKLAPVEGMALFFDASRLDSFANSFRSTATNYILANRKTLGAVAVLSGSALIAMAVSATNLALGGMVASYRKRDDFLAAQREIARQQGLDLAKLAG
jgi:hypothetical protein